MHNLTSIFKNHADLGDGYPGIIICKKIWCTLELSSIMCVGYKMRKHLHDHENAHDQLFRTRHPASIPPAGNRSPRSRWGGTASLLKGGPLKGPSWSFLASPRPSTSPDFSHLRSPSSYKWTHTEGSLASLLTRIWVDRQFYQRGRGKREIWVQRAQVFFRRVHPTDGFAGSAPVKLCSLVTTRGQCDTAISPNWQQFSSVAQACQILCGPMNRTTPGLPAHHQLRSPPKPMSIELVVPTISSSAVPFSCCPQSFPASGSFPMSQPFTWGGQSIGVSDSTSVFQWTPKTDLL